MVSVIIFISRSSRCANLSIDNWVLRRRMLLYLACLAGFFSYIISPLNFTKISRQIQSSPFSFNVWDVSHFFILSYHNNLISRKICVKFSLLPFLSIFGMSHISSLFLSHNNAVSNLFHNFINILETSR